MLREQFPSIIRSSIIKSIAILPIIILLVSPVLKCKKKDTGVQATEKVKIKNRYLNETALFLAGMSVPKDSTLYSYTQKNAFKTYKKHTDKSWKMVDATLNKINAWKKKYLPEKYSSTIYYPFSGPDILNAIAFYPDGNEYFMFGMEPPGQIPDPMSLSGKRKYAGLWGIRKSLGNLFVNNYFLTLRMQKDMGVKSYSGIIGVMMFFLARSGYEVVNIEKVWLDENSKITPMHNRPKSKKRIKGAIITFRKGQNAPLKKAYYFSLNVIDRSLKFYNNFIPFFEKQKRFTTFIKAASYLMHNPRFVKMRNLALSHSNTILQDESGIALKFFNEKEWKLTFHGYYRKPVPLFANCFQRELLEKCKKHSTGPLPFAYGYHNKPGETNVMFAEQKRESSQ